MMAFPKFELANLYEALARTIIRCCRVISCLLLFLSACLSGQTYKFDLYDQAQGLKNLQVQDLAFDKEGFLWVATNNGLFRFLGSQFERYGSEQGLLDRDVLELYVDPQGRIWVGTQGNLYLRTGDRFSTIGPPVSVESTGRHMLTTEANRLLVINKGQLQEIKLNATGDYVSSAFVFPSWQRNLRPELNTINSLAMTKDGTLWLSCGPGICSFAKGTLRNWGPADGVKAHFWRRLYVDRRGSLWAVTNNDLLELRPGLKRFEDRQMPKIDPGRYFPWRAFIEDRQGRILIDSAAGLARHDGVSWQLIGQENGLSDSAVTSLAVDANGDPWIGTLGGVSHWTGYEHWEGWTKKQGLPDSKIWSLSAVDPERVLVGTVKGPASIDTRNNRVTSLTGGRPWPYGQVSGIAQDRQGQIWSATFSGWVLRMDPRSLSIKPVANLHAFVHRIFALDGRIWIISYKGIDVGDESDSSLTVRHVNEADALLGGPRDTWSMTRGGVANKELYFLSSHALVRYGSGGWSKVSFSGFNVEKVDLREITSASDGTLWVAGHDEARHNGIWRLKSSGADLEAIRLSLPASLNEVRLYSLLVDHRGWVWVGSDYGLAGWNGSAWRIFNQESGLISNDTNRGVLSEAPDGSIWVGTAHGGTHLLNPESAFNTITLPIAITTMQRGDASYTPGKMATLPWARSNLRFGFASPMTWNRSGLSFSYRVDGLDSAWTSTQDTEASFSNLPPGRYRFQVFARNSGVSSASAVMESPFHILPPWWRTVWFYGICILAGALLVWFVHRLRTRHLRFKKRQLEQLVQEMSVETTRLAKREQDAVMAEDRNRLAHELHDTLAGAFTGIFMQLQAASDLAASNEDRSQECVARAEELSRDGLRRVREFVQSLTISAENPAPTVDAMRRFVTTTTEGTATIGTFVLEGSERPIKPVCALALMRIIQEAIGNAQRYAGARNIEVRLRFEEGSLALSIRDDGKGFVVKERGEIGFGITGMRARAERLSGKYRLQSAPGAGTTIDVEFPNAFEEQLQPQ